ncbi:hypothetical protein KA344_01120 [bacterium]|nr:hypothetical protein [bacterium]
MSKESLENVQISDGNANVSSLLSPELADYNKTSVQNRSVDKSLTVNADNTLSFGVNDLYGDSSQKSRTGSTNDLFISSKGDFNTLNTDSDKDPANDVVSRAEVTKGAVTELMAADSRGNGNGVIDKDEWMKVSSKFGFNKEGAEQVYNTAIEQGKAGLTLSEQVDKLITPGIMAADLNNNGLDRREFNSLLGRGHHSLDQQTANNPFITAASDFDLANVNKARNPAKDALTKDEVTQAALDVLLKSNTNGNDRVDRDEWMKVSSQFGYDQAGAARAYDIGTKLDRNGLSLREITEKIITPGIMAADTNNSGGIDRNEFNALVPKPTTTANTGDNSGFGPAVTPANNGDGFGPVVTGDNSGFGPAVTPANNGDGFGPVVTANNNGFGPAVG